MRGAVLYKLGLDFVKDRIMRRSYGVAMNVAFRSGHHPNSRKVTSLDGVVRCEDVMHWYAYKVRTTIPRGSDWPYRVDCSISPESF
jgi:hypothetical protein